MRGELPVARFWEDQEFCAILDAFPSTYGMALLLPKKHYDSDPLALPTEIYQRAFEAARHVAAILKRGLNVNRVAIVAEGMGVNHFHIKLYPLHGVDAEWKPLHHGVRCYWDHYPGYLSTQMGPPCSSEELGHLAQLLVDAEKTV